MDFNRVIRNALLSPDGKLFECEDCGHLDLACGILSLPASANPLDLLEDRGWLVVSVTGTYQSYVTAPGQPSLILTTAQESTLFDMYIGLKSLGMERLTVYQKYALNGIGRLIISNWKELI